MPLIAPTNAPAIPLVLIDPPGFSDWLSDQDVASRTWATASGFAAGLGEILALPSKDGTIKQVLFGWGTGRARSRGRFHLAAAVEKLPAGQYFLVPGQMPIDLETEVLGWLLAEYRFDRYRSQPARTLDLISPDEVNAERIAIIAKAAALTLDLVNTPANDLGPEALEAAFLDLASHHGAATNVIRGEALREANFPMIHAVGAAATEAPRLLELIWGRSDAPRVTLVGKGVCFDTGGLNIKPGSSMGLMKKDMGGAATAMGLASMIMGLGLDLRLRVLVPAVENAISGSAMRPGDILRSRKGLSVEVNNTDAEGRLVLADALALADEDPPDLLVSLATLTGAARVALGPDVPAFFTDDDELSGALSSAATAVDDPLWRLPFWEPYESMIEPGIADLDNAPSGGMAGAITAALFLRRFVERTPRYVHIDLYAWNPTARPGRPKGGAFQTARAILRVLEERFCRTP